MRRELSHVMDEDRHLRQCCSTLPNLAYFLDLEFIGHAAPHQNDVGITHEEYGKMFDAFSDHVYSEPFRTTALSHLYNFEAEDTHLLFDVVAGRKAQPSRGLARSGRADEPILHPPLWRRQLFRRDRSDRPNG